MDTDRNLLFGVLALQADLITAPQFVDACTLWAARKHIPLADLLVERGWLRPADRALVDQLLQRRLGAQGDAGSQTPTPLATVPHAQRPEDRYRLEDLHGEGGIGRVWLAHDSQFDRKVALKELLPERADNAEFRTRFIQEARITGQLEHPGIVPVYELARRFGDGQPFYTMRLVQGRTLAAAAQDYHARRCEGREEALDFVTLLNAFVAVCNAVAYAHSRGVLHRDLKGSNVLLGDFGEVILLDWGLAKQLEGGDPEGSDRTLPGQAIGTPAYMAPEQALGRIDLIDRRTDVYGLGAILYEILTGRPPFTGHDASEVLRRVQKEAPIPPHGVWPEVPRGLEAVCLRALSKDPARRYASALEPAQEVQGWQETQRRQAEDALRATLEQLRASEAQYRALIETIPHFVWRAGLDGQMDYYSPRGFEYSGLTPAESIGDGWLRVVHPDDLARTWDRWSEALRSGASYEIEFRLRRFDGVYRWHLSRAVPVRDPAGRVLRWIGTCTDVDDQKRAAEQLRASEAHYHALADAIPQIVWIADPDGTNRYLNRRWFEYSGLTPEQSAVKGWLQAVHPDDAPLAVARWQQALETGEGFEIEYRLRRGSDGAYRWHLGRALPVRDGEGRIVRWFGTCTDIEDQKQAEAALRETTDRSKTVLAAACVDRKKGSPQT